MEFNTFTQELRELLIEGKTQTALDQLLDFYDDKKGEYYDEVIVLASQMRRLRDKSIAGAISGEEANQQANNINHSLLQIIDDLHNDAAVARHFGLEEPKAREIPEKKETKSGRVSIGKTLIGMLFGGLIGFFTIKALTPAEPLTPEERKQREIVEPQEEVPSTFEPTERRITPPETETTSPPREEQNTQVQEETTTPAPPKNDPPAPKKSFNNTPNKALPLSFDKSVRAMLNSPEDRNYFKVDISKAGRLTVDYQCLSEELRARLQVFDKNNNRILQNTASGKGASFEQSFSVREGRYVLLMETYNSQSGKYELQVKLN
ncbi:MAG: hypothetical protein AAF806_13105 [Bacteroidota bacterium]